MKDTVLGDNKYLNNLQKNTKKNFSIPAGSRIIPEQNSPPPQYEQTSSEKKKFGRNLFADFKDESLEGSPGELSLIPELTEEGLTNLVRSFNTRNDLNNDKYSSNGDSEHSKDSESSHPIKDDDSYHTPEKKDDFEFITMKNTTTAKKEPKSKITSMFSNTLDTADKDFKIENNHNPKKFEKQKSLSNRFNQDYTILETLGSGNFGTVYKCQNKLEGLIYAIKCTHNKLKGGPNLDQALNEAQALASLSALGENEFIVRYFNAWIEDNRLYLVMEHCQSNLKALRQKYMRFSEHEIRQIMRDICMGLKHLHKQRIVHLDIKPENILYSKTHKYKIGDLGMSRIAHRQNGEDINEGDCRYLALELLNDFPEHQLPDLTKADIFSFGITMYELMVGTDLPKNGPDWQALRNGDLHKIEHLNYSNSLKTMIKAMMNPNPDQRPPAETLLKTYLQSEIELELKWEREENQRLKKQVKELEKQLKIRRKNSF